MSQLHHRLLAVLERPHRLGMIGGDLEEQLAHCASFSSVLAEVLDARGHIWSAGGVPRCLDLGTGGGLPGVALAAMLPQTRWCLLDQRSGRTAEVERVVAALGLAETVSVITGQAQELAHQVGHREVYDAVVARAFGPTSLTAECAAGLVAIGGTLIVSEPPVESNPDRWPEDSLEALGLRLLARTVGVDTNAHQFALFRKTGPAPALIPRLPARADRGWPRGS